MNPRIWYFCHICDNYRENGCELLGEERQELRVNKGSCGSAEIYGRSVEIYMKYIKINGQTFRRGSRDFSRLLRELKKLKKD